MITITQGTRILIGILFLPLLWFAGIKFFQADSPKVGIPVSFTFTLPSLREMLGPTGETDLFFSEAIQWASLSGSNTLFSPTNTPPDPFEKALVFLPGKLRVQPMTDFR